ncbi:MAG: pilus assembly protein N-terminal domain-containing protein, partial [Candidatus Omnitrophica bacterium]|nr:pilus assembly protein N-terminal domain-containing protein [Candidatus Omnitrophota bacterium]
MERKSLYILGIIYFCLIHPISIYGQQLSYHYLLAKGKEALAKEFYEEAINYFTLAHIISPSSSEPLFYIDFAKRLKEGFIEEAMPIGVKIPEREITPPQKEREYRVLPLKEGRKKKKEEVIQETLKLFQKRPEEVSVYEEAPFEDKGRRKRIEKILSLIEKKREKEEKLMVKMRGVPFRKPKVEEKEVAKEERTLWLDDELWVTQPKTTIEIEQNKSVIIRGKDIERFLAVDPETIEVKKIDRDALKIIGSKRGSTFLHLWETKGRWTFIVKVIFPIEVPSLGIREGALEELVNPFKLAYSISGSSYYEGKRLGTVNKKSYGVSQWGRLSGETPYGDMFATGSFSGF